MKFTLVLAIFALIFAEASLGDYIGCNTTQDLAAFQKEWDTFHGKLDKCATRCLAQYNCANACVKRELGLTAECSSCFANNIVCTATKCMSECVADHSSEKCMNCYNEKCYPEVLVCANVDPKVLPP